MLTRMEEGLALLVRAGMTVPDAVRAFRICSDYTRGFVLLEQGLDDEEAEKDGQSLDGLVLDPKRYRTIHAGGGIDAIITLHDEDFTLGLRLLIDSIERQLIHARPPTRRAPARARTPAPPG
jgi:hypothetical protein